MKQHLFRRILAAFMAVAMLAAAACVPAFAREIKGTKKVLVNYVVSDNDKSIDFVYSDAFFNQSGYKYSQDLAKISNGLAVASGGSQRARKSGKMRDQNQNFVQFADACEFEKFQSSEYMKKRPLRDSIGINCASKKIHDDKGEATLVAVSVRGFGYQNEWADNGNIGASGDHTGFTESAKKSLAFLKQYLKNIGADGRVKVWISGYSRGAVVANIASAMLDDGYNLGSKISFSPEDLYSYPMEPPMGTMKEKTMDKKYDNIHNIVNPVDVVTVVPFKDWGFARYGIDHYVPTKADSNYASYRDAMVKYMRSIPNDVYNIYWPDLFQAWNAVKVGPGYVFTKSDELQPEFYNDLSKAVCTGMTSSREDYYENLQLYVMDILELFNREDVKATDALKTWAKTIAENWQDVMNSLSDTEKAEDLILGYLADAMKENNITSYNEDYYEGMVKTLLPRVKKMAEEYPSTTATLIANLVTIVAAHSEAPCQSWLKTLPNDYMASHTGYSYNM